MTLVGGLVILPVSRRNLVRAPVIAAAIGCLENTYRGIQGRLPLPQKSQNLWWLE
jgi:hypothetical protein